MPRVCGPCIHPDRASIDEALVSNRGSIRGIARQHALSPDALERHAKSHLPATVALAVRAAEVTRADDLLGLLREAVKDARRLRGLAEADRDYRAAIGAVKVLCDVVERLAAIGEKLALAEAAKPPELKPTLTDGELINLVARLLAAPTQENVDA